MSRCVFAVLVLLLGLPARAPATGGTRLTGIGPAQSAVVGGAMASPQDASWMALNPASLVELPSRVDLAGEALIPTSHLDANGAGTNPGAKGLV